MKTKIERSVAEMFEKANEVAQRRIREELETAWLRGWLACRASGHLTNDERETSSEQMAADYAERVVGGSTRPEKPNER